MDAGGLLQLEFRDITEQITGTIVAAQYECSRFAAEGRARALLLSVSPVSQAGSRALVRLPSSACRPVSAWLHTLPHTP
jgi:hypothetical protein